MKIKDYVKLAKKMNGIVTYQGDEGHISFPTVWHKEQFENLVAEADVTKTTPARIGPFDDLGGE